MIVSLVVMKSITRIGHQFTLLMHLLQRQNVASLLTSSYPTEHGVKTTPGHLDPRTDLGLGVDIDNTKVSSKTIDRPNLMRLVNKQQSGYDVAWKGKWQAYGVFKI